MSAAARAALAPTAAVGAAVVFAKLANQATSFVGYNSVVDVPQRLLIRSDALLTNPVAPFTPSIALADTDLATGVDRIGEEYADANGVGGQVAGALGPVRTFLASALADPDLMGTSYVHSAAGAAGATGVAGGISYVDVYNLAGSAIASGAVVNQNTPGAGADQDVEIDATATVNVSTSPACRPRCRTPAARRAASASAATSASCSSTTTRARTSTTSSRSTPPATSRSTRSCTPTS